MIKPERNIWSAAVPAAHTVRTERSSVFFAVEKLPLNGAPKTRARIARADAGRREPPGRRRSANCVVPAKTRAAPEAGAPWATARGTAFVRFFIFVIAHLLAAPVLFAQLPPGAQAQRGIEMPDYDRQTQRLKSLLRGQSAVQLPNGGVLLNSMRVEIYSYDGETRKVDVVVEAPSCTFDFKERVASSPGPLLMRREDGKLLVAGVGFEWRQLSAQLYISNNVQTVIARGSRGL